MLAQPIKEQKKKIKLSELSDLLKVKKSTIKQWEKDFNIQATGSLYSEQEITLFKKIKQLLHQNGTSFENAKKEIEKFFAATQAASFQSAENDTKESKTEQIIEKTIEKSLIFEEKQNFDLKTITQLLQNEKTEIFHQATKDSIAKSINTDKQQLLSEKAALNKGITTEVILDQSFKTTLQTIKSIALVLREKLQK